MKKYLIFGIISGLVYAKLYPLWSVMLMLLEFYGTGIATRNLVKLITAAVCIFISTLIWVKLKAKLSVKNLLLLLAGCVIGMVLITSGHLYGLMATMKNGVMQSYSLGPIKVSNLALYVALDFKDTSTWINHVAMLVIQIVPYLITCFGSKLKNKV